MSREEIVRQLRAYFKEGKLICKARDKYYHGYDRQVHIGKLFRTRHRSIVATDLETSEWLNELIRTDRIMESQVVSCVHRDLTNDYAIQKACMCDDLIKFDDCGRGCVLYID